jgi:hypothetical protein
MEGGTEAPLGLAVCWDHGKLRATPIVFRRVRLAYQQYFSLRTNQPPATSQQYFSLRTNQHPGAKPEKMAIGVCFINQRGHVACEQ